MNIGICGISGRMGIAVLRIILERGHNLKAAFDSENIPMFGRNAGDLIHKNDLQVKISSLNQADTVQVDGIIDFSIPQATLKLIELAVHNKKPLVIGTTGFSIHEKESIRKASEVIPILFSPNMSFGVNLLFKLTEIASKVLDPSYDVEIFEAHHRFKKDSPSGTAKMLIDIVKNNMKGLSDADVVNGRDGLVGERTNKEIGIMSMRGGDIVGEHTVFFTGMGERIELTHKASSRDTLARGAVMGLEYIYGKSPGLYSMYDVLGL